MAIKRGTEIPTIDVNLVTVKLEGETDEIALDTASKISVAPEVETTDPVKLIIKGVLKAQKGQETTITGHTITLSDNVFTPELVLALQGGKITYDTDDTNKIVKYEPPISGQKNDIKPFGINSYSAVYDNAGTIIRYEKTTWPNCKGQPIAIEREDGAFSVAEYTIMSAPKTGEPPYVIEFVDDLPTVS